MNIETVDALLEQIFVEADVEDYPEPEQNPRFKWQPPPTHGPEKMGGVGGDPKMRGVPPGLMNAVSGPASNLADPEDRIGKYSMKDLLPDEEVASKDDLIDFMSRIAKAKGKKRKSWEQEFRAHAPEFESKLRQFVDALLC